MTYRIQDTNESITATETNGQSSLEIERTMNVFDYAGGKEAMADLLGGYVRIGNYLIRRRPLRHPLYTWTRCSRVQLKPFGSEPAYVYTSSTPVTGMLGLARQPNCAQGVLTASYSLPTLPEDKIDNNGQGDNPNQEKEIATENWDFSAQYMDLDANFMKWQTSGDFLRPQEIKAKKYYPEITLVLVRHRVLFKPLVAISQLLGKINHSSFTIVRDNYPSNCVLFNGASCSRRLTAGGGLPFFEITYRFMIRCIYEKLSTGSKGFAGWNHYYNPARAWWERVQWKSDDTKFTYDLDEDQPAQTLNGVSVTGFDLLFHPLAS